MLDALAPVTQDDLFARFAGDADPPLVLCATRRLVQTLEIAHAGLRRAAGDPAWPTPPILTLPLWLAQRWDEAVRLAALAGEALPGVLSPAEAMVLWRAAIERDRLHLPLLSVAQAARLAAEAWQRSQDFGLEPPFDARGHADVAAFNRWAGHFRTRLARLEAIDPAELPARVAALIASRAQVPPREVVLAGFDRLTPAQARLFSTLREHGSVLWRLAPAQERAGCAGRVALATSEQELRAAARWARALAEAQPAARIGIVVADLGTLRADLVRIFDEVLCPGRAPGAPRPYNVSLGLPLAETWPVREALGWLAWFASRDGVPLPEARACLLSRCWSGGARPDQAARADLALRDARRTRVRPEEVDLRPLGSLRLAQDAASPGAWSARFGALLDALGWPGPEALDSGAWQAVEKWQRLLADFARLGRVAPKLRAGEAVALLEQLAKDQTFQPRSAPAAIQVLGALEAGGLRFDHLRLLGMDEEAWPPRAEPHPLLPLALQRQHGLPHASPAQELAFAREVTARLLASAPRVVVSHACLDGDSERAVSPLFRHLPELEEAAAEALPARWRSLFEARGEEVAEDATAPGPAAGAVVPGGVNRLADQAACPFRGFARHHLGAAAPEDPAPALDAMERGLIAHAALARFWRETRDQAGLRALDAPARSARLEACIAASFEAYQRDHPGRVGPRLCALESARLRGNILELLALELERQPFAVELIEGGPIDGPEATALIALAGLHFRLRIDRVDRLPDGSRIVLDYKTGKVAGSFAQARPDAPQLPLYAVLEPACRGVAYASLASGEVAFKGVAAQDDWIPGVRAAAEATRRSAHPAEDWDALQAFWRGELEALAAEVRDGRAVVDPKPQACRQCDLHALCRVREARPLAALDEAEDAA
jgi:ATP-dependent helicase/nuclease subunit B